MSTAREYFTATRLNNGMVLIVGGLATGGVLLNSTELYDPTTGNFTPASSLITGRYFHAATLLNNGGVLITGGQSVGTSPAFTTAEIYNLATGVFTLTTNNMATGHALHTATPLNNGTVLVAGGYNNGGFVDGAELFNPSTGNFTSTGSLNTASFAHTATLLNNGMVLVAGGYSNGSYLARAGVIQPYDRDLHLQWQSEHRQRGPHGDAIEQRYGASCGRLQLQWFHS